MEKELTLEQFMELNIKDFEIKRQFEPKFLGMKKSNIYKIEYDDNRIYGYDKDNNLVYYERIDGYWWVITYDEKGEFFSREDSDGNKTRIINGKNFKYKNGKFFYDGVEMVYKK